MSAWFLDSELSTCLMRYGHNLKLLCVVDIMIKGNRTHKVKHVSFKSRYLFSKTVCIDGHHYLMSNGLQKF